MLSATLFTLCFSAHAQQPGKVFRVGYLSAINAASDVRSKLLRRALGEFGYIEGRNLGIEYQYAEGDTDRQRVQAAELVRLKVDVIVVAGGDDGIRATKSATKTIPIIMTGPGSDPVKAGFIASLANPGGN